MGRRMGGVWRACSPYRYAKQRKARYARSSVSAQHRSRARCCTACAFAAHRVSAHRIITAPAHEQHSLLAVSARMFHRYSKQSGSSRLYDWSMRECIALLRPDISNRKRLAFIGINLLTKSPHCSVAMPNHQISLKRPAICKRHAPHAFCAHALPRKQQAHCAAQTLPINSRRASPSSELARRLCTMPGYLSRITAGC